MKATTCVPKPELARFILGKVEAERLEEIAEHVEACQVCQDTVVALSDKSDTFVQGIRDAQADAPFESESACQARLGQMFASGSRSGSEPGPVSRVDVGLRLGEPDHLGPYRIEQRLGVGGMGTVFRATHTKLKRTVALKVLPADRWAHAEAVSRFEREMEAIGQMDHPHIVRASDAGEERGMHYLVMDFVVGMDLSRIVSRLGPLPVAEACELARQAAMGLQYAQDKKLVHRDIKPSNLMLAWPQGTDRPDDATPTVKILDLGLALLGDAQLQNQHELTTVGQLMGTLDYMAPEQGADSHDVDARTDIYSLGATLFKLLTGRAPFVQPRYNTLLKKVTALATDPAPSLATADRDLPKELVHVVDRMLARQPQDRFASAREVAETLAPFSQGADLTGLLQQAEQSEDAEPGLAQSAAVFASRLSPPETPPRDDEQHTATPGPPARGGGRSSFRRWIAAAMAGFVLFAASVVVLVATDYGELVIHCQAPDVKVLVRQGKRRVKEIEVEQGNDNVTTIRSGTYEIELLAASDQLSISRDRFVISRGGQEVVTIDRKPLASATARDEEPAGLLDVAAFGENTARQPQYDGKAYDHWLEELKFERKPERLAEALKALASLGGQERSDETARAIMGVMRRHGSREGIDGGPRGKLIDEARSILWQLPFDTLVALMLEEIREGSQQSREFTTGMLTPFFHTGGEDGEHDRLLAQWQAAVRRQAEPMVGRLLALLGSDSDERDWAFQFLVNLCERGYIDCTKHARALALLQESLHSDDSEQVLAAAGALASSAPASNGLAQAIARVLPELPLDEQVVAVRHLKKLGSHAAPAVPALLKLLHECSFAPSSFGILGREDMRQGMKRSLQLGPEIATTFGAIGPTAKAALPTLRSMAEDRPWLRQRDLIHEAIEQISVKEVSNVDAQVSQQSSPAQTPDETELDKFVEIAESELGVVELRHQAGQASVEKLGRARISLVEAKLRRAEAREDTDDRLALLDELVKLWEAQHRTVDTMYKEGMAGQDSVFQAQKELLKAQVRLRKAREGATD